MAVIDLPEPDSPTRPRISPGAISNEMPSTSVLPFGARTVRSLTSTSASGRAEEPRAARRPRVDRAARELRGSRYTARPSPVSIAATPAKTSMTEGPITCRGCEYTAGSPSLSRRPQSNSGLCTPRPTNDRLEMSSR